jgi:hypothetical protein
MPHQPIARRFDWIWFALLILSTIPAIVILALIFRYGVNVPYYDQWDCEGKLFKSFWEHQLTWRDFWEQHNEHRMFFPKMIYLALAYATRWNVIAELIVTWLCVCIVSFSVYRMYRSADGPVSAGKMIPFIAANILIFTPACAEAWLWGVSVANLMPMACIIGAMAIACSNLHANLRWGLCAVLAIVATFSTASGLLCWILCAPLLFLRKNSLAVEGRDESAGSSPFRLWHMVAWGCGFAMTTAIYFYHYARPAAHPPPSDALKHPIDVLFFLLLYEGNSITFMSPTIDYLLAARFIGGVMIALMLVLCVYIANRWRDRSMCDRALIWLMIGAYSILNGMLIAVSRMEITPIAATWTRYVSYSIFLPVSLIFLVPILVEDVSRHVRPEIGPILMRTACGLLAATMVFQIFKFCDGVASFAEIRAVRAERKASLLFIDVVRFDSTTAKSWREQTLDDIRPVADALNAHGWINPPLIQRPRMQDLEDSTVTKSEPYGKIEQVGDVGDGKIGIIGWAYEPRRRSLADAVVLSWEKPGGDAVPFAIAQMGIERSSEGTDSPLRYSGWQLGFPSDLLPAGTLDLRAWCLDTSTAKAVALPGYYRLTINPPPPGGP